MVCGRRSKAARELEAFETVRLTTLQRLLQSEASRAWQTYDDGVKFKLHEQCMKDFDRCEYALGTRVYAKAAAAAKGMRNAQLELFAGDLLETCRGHHKLAHVVSALLSQISMAHLGSVCWSGPQSFSVPAGCARPRYMVQETDAGVKLTIARICEGFDTWTMPGEEPYECHADSSIKQQASLLLSLGHGDVKLTVTDAFEEMRLIWANERLVTWNGLELDFRSPPLPKVMGTDTLFTVAGFGAALGILIPLAWTDDPKIAPYRAMVMESVGGRVRKVFPHVDSLSDAILVMLPAVLLENHMDVMHASLFMALMTFGSVMLYLTWKVYKE
eukprot:TRINITY_DN28996_c0_g1_i1.p1 TRINITY_DN28996_c0_g1~~TRINITY_DN28996_c0_g1_i1.p1  ORF type:complete len:330 (-),score=80.26 TRINITY_DN28996_c0_g1_i1:210-1199(-)